MIRPLIVYQFQYLNTAGHFVDMPLACFTKTRADTMLAGLSRMAPTTTYRYQKRRQSSGLIKNR